MMKWAFLPILCSLVFVPSLASKDTDDARTGALKLLTGGEKGVLEFNKWRENQPHLVLDLSKAKLKGVDLSRANLSSIDLSEADLSGAHLWRTYFYRTNLRGANLSGVSFNEADFRGASYIYATMSEELLQEIELQNRRTVTIAK